MGRPDRGGHVVRGRGRHALEHAVTPDERMKQRRRDMQQDQREERESEIEMRVPEQRVQASLCGRIAGSRMPAPRTTG